MTLTETKARIRHARRLMKDLRAEVNSRGLRWVPTAIHLGRDDFDVLEWGMGHLLKDWVYDEYTADGEPVKASARFVRMRGYYTRNDGTDNFMFKGIPVRCAEPIGLQ